MKKTILLALLVLMGVGLVNAQTRVTGTVTSADDGQPLPYVTITVKGTSTITTSDLEGKYSITLPEGYDVLTFSFSGMQTEDVSVGNRSIIDLAMTSDATLLEDAIVVGYGTQTAKSPTSVVATVKAEAIKDLPAISAEQALQGRATGVQITSPAGIVGQPPIVRVRGVNSITSGTSPLYVVDGVPMFTGDVGQVGQANALADINPSDIQSMDVLKDASAAALYGSRAANGVILITTKSGRRDRTRVTYDGWFGFSNKTKFVDLMNAQQYVDFKNLSVKNTFGTDERSVTPGYTSPYGTKAFNLMRDSKGNIIDSDWSETVFQTGWSQSHSVAVSGGGEKATFYISGNYIDQDGMVIGDSYDRLGMKANVNVKATDWLRLNGNVNVANGTTQYTDAARKGSNFAVGGFPRLAIVNAPNIPIYNEDGTPYYTTAGLGFGPNTVSSTYSNPAQLVEQGNRMTMETVRYIANFSAEANPIKNLAFKTQYGIDRLFSEEERFWSPLHGDGASSAKGSAYGIEQKMERWTWTNTIDYNFSIKKHNIGLLAGMEASDNNERYWYIYRTGLTDLKWDYLQGSYINNDGGGYRSSNALVSYFGRINYDYDSKYLFAANFRRDGYSALGDNNRWGNFGGVSAAWRISRESFFEPIADVINDFKVMGSWGLVGNVNILDYASKSYYDAGYYGGDGIYYLRQMGDSNLKWEMSEKIDVGFTMQLFNRINVEFDYYHTKTKDLILDVPQSPSKGVPDNIIKANVGEMKNSGIELTVSADIINKKNFRWNSSFNITTNKNEVTKLAEGVTEILGQDRSNLEITNKTVVGKSIAQLYALKTNGVDKNTGRRIVELRDGTELLIVFEKDAAMHGGTGALAGYYYKNDPTRYYGALATVGVDDYQMFGNSLPTYYGGWNNTFNFYNFDVTLFFQYSGGNKVLNGTKASTADMRYWNNAVDVYDNHWTPERTDATYAMPIYGDNFSNGSAHPISDWVEKGDYLRLKNLIIGYTFNTSGWPKKIGVSSLRLYGQVQNLFTITGYDGLDPEALTNVTRANLAGGTDKNTMPQARTFTFGVNLTF